MENASIAKGWGWGEIGERELKEFGAAAGRGWGIYAFLRNETIFRVLTVGSIGCLMEILWKIRGIGVPLELRIVPLDQTEFGMMPPKWNWLNAGGEMCGGTDFGPGEFANGNSSRAGWKRYSSS